MGLDSRNVREGLKHPLKAAVYLRYRLRDFLTAGRLSFDSDAMSGAETFPALCRELHVETRLLDEILNGKTAEQSLEIGCGFGRLTPWIADYSDQHYAVEPEESLLASARQMHPEVAYANTTAQDLPYPDNKFDLVVSWTVLMHVPDEQIRDVCDELCRVTGDEATVILAEKTGDQFETARSFTRSADEYGELLGPFTLAGSMSRPMKSGGWETSHEVTVMRFQRHR